MRIFAVGTKILWGGGLANIWGPVPPLGPNVEPPLVINYNAVDRPTFSVPLDYAPHKLPNSRGCVVFVSDRQTQPLSLR